MIWGIIPFDKWLITMVSEFPKYRVGLSRVTLQKTLHTERWNGKPTQPTSTEVLSPEGNGLSVACSEVILPSATGQLGSLEKQTTFFGGTINRPSQKETSIPTIHFQGLWLLVSGYFRNHSGIYWSNFSD